MSILKHVTVIEKPCDRKCPACARGVNDGEGNILHLGNYFTDANGNPEPSAVGNFPLRPEWNMPSDWSTRTHKNFPVTLRVATTKDAEELINTPSVFPMYKAGQANFTIQTVREFTDRRGLYYPYICIAIAEGRIVSRLFLDPNPENAVQRQLKNVAIMDSGVTDPEYSDRGAMDALLQYAEQFAYQNGIRWLEIGCKKDAPDTAPEHQRRGTDSLRLALRRAYHRVPTIVHHPIFIHYQARNLPVDSQGRTPATMDSRRYGNALVIYKDLKRTEPLPAHQLASTYEELVALIPD